MPGDNRAPASPPTLAQQRFARGSAAILLDIVVLNLFVEYFDEIVIDSFTISLLAAILIRLLIEATLRAEHRVAAFFTSRGGAGAKVGRVFGAWLVLFLSKFVILEAVDIVFGEHVELGGFLGIIFLSAAMVVAERVVLAIYRRL